MLFFEPPRGSTSHELGTFDGACCSQLQGELPLDLQVSSSNLLSSLDALIRTLSQRVKTREILTICLVAAAWNDTVLSSLERSFSSLVHKQDPPAVGEKMTAKSILSPLVFCSPFCNFLYHSWYQCLDSLSLCAISLLDAVGNVASLSAMLYMQKSTGLERSRAIHSDPERHISHIVHLSEVHKYILFYRPQDSDDPIPSFSHSSAVVIRRVSFTEMEEQV